MSHRKMTPKGQMSSSGSGPAIMMMPPHVRATFMPNPPLKQLPPIKNKRKHPWTGMSQYMVQFERAEPPPRTVGHTPRALKKKNLEKKKASHEEEMKPKIESFRKKQKEDGGEYEGMNCFNTLFVGRLAYEVTERKLLREFEVFGTVKDLKLIKGKDQKSRGYAFVEFENEEDMKRAYRAADAMKIEGREIVVDVERGHTVPNWLPRRLGGGLGGTRLGGKEKNVTYPGRFDPSRPEASARPGGGPDGPMGRGRGPPPYGYGGGGRGGPGGYGGGPPPYNGRGGPPPPYGMGRGGGGPPRGGGRDWERDRGGGGRYGGRNDYHDRKRHRSRSRSPERRHSHSRQRRY